ncbi:cytidylyltransferase domain-containing protein [Turneriella parva]|uniref:Acylneuraminate cytidylyltransferase n=1 Tax=Turneriella parva (strain ATCC BAA-1111 / DSM 21527 / NCTC 11395 / H) TaxID=869212 RepID=I4BAQ4_TURPD|nr:acylneuraminate cytidylyltransferase [Turneriella parva]AFM14361.1 acylneuraminate cytidylyltransferase [Turneriella parva DSM 21527]
MRFRAIVQARMASERLPGKVLQTIGSLSILEHIARRFATLEGANVALHFAIAREEASPLPTYLSERGWNFTEGDVYDVLQRYLDASSDLDDTDYVIRVTGDNPFTDKDELARLIMKLKSRPVDYAHTADLPLGMGSEIIRVNALRSIRLRAEPATPGGASEILPHHREHVTMFVRENPHLYEIYSQPLDETFSEELAKARVRGIRMTVDEPQDLEVARKVYLHFERLAKPLFGAAEVIQLAKNSPEMFASNANIAQRPATSVDARAN